MAQAFDSKHLTVRGVPTAIADHVPVFGAQQHGLFSASDTGILAFHSKMEVLAQPVWVDLAGKNPEPLVEPAVFGSYDVRLAPGGRKVALGITDLKEGVENIWVHDATSRQTTRLTFEKLIAQRPVWSPDGTQLLYASNRIGRPQTFKIPVNGIGEAEPFFPSEYSSIAESWSPDGRYVVFRRAPSDGTGESRLWVAAVSGDMKPHELLPAAHAHSWDAAFSPDGKWLAYASNESGEQQIYIVPFPDPRMKIRVSKDRGSRPHWTSDSRKLYFVGKDHLLMSASLQPTSDGLAVAETHALFKLEIAEFDVSPDGKRFLIFKTTENQEPSTVTLITNWTNLLNR